MREAGSEIQVSSNEQAKERVREITQICESLAFDTEIQAIPNEPDSLAVFLYNDAGSLAETAYVYESLKDQLERTMTKADHYSYTLETWQAGFPYLKLSPK